MNNTLVISLIGLGLGFLYPVFADGFNQPIKVFNGVSIGLAGGFTLAMLEQYVFNWQTRRLSFKIIVILKTLCYLILMVILIVAIKGINESIYYGEGLTEYLYGSRFQEFRYREDFDIIVLYSLICIGIIVFTREMSRKMGHMVLFHFITGKYYEPRVEERIFMFLDLRSSTTIAEEMGDMKYYHFLNDFFHDITECILLTKGEIYRYVGDEVVVTWSMKNGLNNSNWIRTYFHIKNEVDQLKEKYLSEYNFVPEFTSSFHCGEVVLGEIGDVKSQIVFHGEPLYTTALVEKQCTSINKQVLATSILINLTSLPLIYSAKRVGQLKEDNTLDLYTIVEIALKAL
jgi:adenylate cyclase